MEQKVMDEWHVADWSRIGAGVPITMNTIDVCLRTIERRDREIKKLKKAVEVCLRTIGKT